MHRRVLGALALALAATGIAAAAVGASSPQAAVSPASFSTPVMVLGGTFDGYTDGISMVVDSTNAIDIAATGRGGLWFITNRGGSWSHKKILANPTNKAWMSRSIAIDSHDHVYIALGRQECNNCTPGGTDGIFLISDKGRAHGSFPATATKVSPYPAGDPSIKVVAGRIYIAYDQYCSCIPGDELQEYLKTSTNGTSWTKSLITNEGRNPDLRVTSNGHAHVAYTRHDGLGYAIAGTQTGSFTNSKVAQTSGDDNDPLLALDANGRARMVFENSTAGYFLRYDRQTAAGWGTPRNITVQVGGFGFDLDTNGTPKVAQGQPTGIHLYTLNGSTWANTTISSIGNAENVTLRRAFNAKVDVAFARASGGIWVTHG